MTEFIRVRWWIASHRSRLSKVHLYDAAQKKITICGLEIPRGTVSTGAGQTYRNCVVKSAGIIRREGARF